MDILDERPLNPGFVGDFKPLERKYKNLSSRYENIVKPFLRKIFDLDIREVCSSGGRYIGSVSRPHREVEGDKVHWDLFKFRLDVGCGKSSGIRMVVAIVYDLKLIIPLEIYTHGASTKDRPVSTKKIKKTRKDIKKMIGSYEKTKRTLIPIAEEEAS